MGETRHRKENGGEVRISGGVFRGQKIKTPGGATHPMGERERIALFNMIFDKIANGRVADLYCGGGTLGIEALSRGANSALFVDNSPRAIEVANENLTKLGIQAPRGEAVVADSVTVAQATADQYGVVIADPPYDKYSDKMVKCLPKLMLSGGILVLSHPGEAPELPGLILEKARSYARANISIYRKVS